MGATGVTQQSACGTSSTDTAQRLLARLSAFVAVCPDFSKRTLRRSRFSVDVRRCVARHSAVSTAAKLPASNVGLFAGTTGQQKGPKVSPIAAPQERRIPDQLHTEL